MATSAIVAGRARADEVAQPAASDYIITSWATDQGLPESDVSDIIQTPDGYLRLLTVTCGLVRFDGKNFAHSDDNTASGIPRLPSGRLLLSPQGTLWVSYDDGTIVLAENGAFTVQVHTQVNVQTLVLGDADKILFAGISGRLLRGQTRAGGPRQWEVFSPDGAAEKAQFMADRQGVVWYVRKDGRVGRLRGEKTEVLPDSMGPQGRARLLLADNEGHPWVQAGSKIARWDGESFVDMTPTNGEPRLVATRLAFAGDGGLWVEAGGRLRRCRNRQWEAEARGWDGKFGPSAAPVIMKGDAEGGVWFLHAGDGVIHVRADGTMNRLSTKNGLPSDVVTSWFQDREGNVWIGSYRGGLTRVRPRCFGAIGRAEGLPESLVTSGCEDREGAIWMGLFSAGVARLEGGNVSSFSLPLKGDRSRNVTTAIDASGQLWLGTSGNGVLVREAGQFSHPFPIEEIHGGIARTILGGRDGKVWMGNEFGLWFYQSNRLSQPVLTKPVCALAEDTSGALWIGTRTGELIRFQDAQFGAFQPPSGPRSSQFWTVHVEQDGTVWIGTPDSGLFRFRQGAFVQFSRKNGFPSDTVSQILEDEQGYLWLATPAGLVRVRKNAFDAWASATGAPAPFQVYGLTDGIPTCDFSRHYQPAGWRSRDGRLWFATSKGAVFVQPADVKVNRLAPEVVIEEVQVDGQTRFRSPLAPGHQAGLAGKISPLRIAPGRHHIDFRFDALSFTAPDKVYFRWKLEGLEKDWEEGQVRRTADYRNLPPGAYTFRVIACNNDRVWNEAGAQFSFVVPPFFWETAWFRSLAAVTVLGGVAGGIQLRYRRKLRRQVAALEQKVALERERTRIAEDLHDEIGAKLSRISFLSDLARRDLPPGQPASQQIGQVTEAARGVIRAVAEIVWAVDPRNDSLAGLAFYAGRLAEEFFELTPIELRCEFPPEFPEGAFSTTVRHSLVCAVKEALQNVLKHAAATRVEVVVTAKANFEILIADNGRGFDAERVLGPASLPVRNGPGLGGRGLRGMRERMQRVGGECRIESQAGSGTRVTFSLPMKNPEPS